MCCMLYVLSLYVVVMWCFVGESRLSALLSRGVVWTGLSCLLNQQLSLPMCSSVVCCERLHDMSFIYQPERKKSAHQFSTPFPIFHFHFLFFPPVFPIHAESSFEAVVPPFVLTKETSPLNHRTSYPAVHPFHITPTKHPRHHMSIHPSIHP